jgi:hypothetical protein
MNVNYDPKSFIVQATGEAYLGQLTLALIKAHRGQL